MPNKYPTEHPTLLEKKARLYVIGGVAIDTDQQDAQVFWFAVNRYGPLHTEYKETDVQNIGQYRDKYEPQQRGEEGWEQFMRDLPQKYHEGDPFWFGGKGQWYKRLTPETLVPMTAIPIDIAAPIGENKRDAQSVRLIISHIREIIWHLPIKGMPYFQAKTTTMGVDVIDELRSRIGPKTAENKNNKRTVMAQSSNLIPIDEMTRYCVVATGQIVNSEDAAIAAIEGYLSEHDTAGGVSQFPSSIFPTEEIETLQRDYIQPRLTAKLAERTDKSTESMMDTLEDIYRSLYEKEAIQEAKVLRKILTRVAVLHKEAMVSLDELAAIYEMGVKNQLGSFELLPVMKGLGFTRWNISALEKVVKYFTEGLTAGKDIVEIINTSNVAFNDALARIREALMKKHLNKRYQEVRDELELEQTYPNIERNRERRELIDATLNRVLNSLEAKGEKQLVQVILNLSKKL